MIVNGKKLAEEELNKIAQRVSTISRPLKLVAVLVGNHPGSKQFLEFKRKAAEKVGIKFERQEFEENLPEAVLASRLRILAQKPENDAVLIELPLPRQFDTSLMLNTVPPDKDVDVLSEAAQKKYFSGDFTILPPAVEAVKIIFEKGGVDPQGKKVAVFGRGLLVGKPVAYWLYRRGAMISVVDEFTKNPEQYSRAADILISGVGRPHLIGGEMIKAGAVVIDFGYNQQPVTGNQPVSSNQLPATSLVGDINFEEAKDKASLITPVPGGVGPLVIAAVLKNLVVLAENKSR